MIIKELIIEKNSLQETKNIIRYAWGNEQLKTWFITKSKKCTMPKSRLLFILTCKKTNKSIDTKETYPKISDIISDENGLLLEIIEIQNF